MKTAIKCFLLLVVIEAVLAELQHEVIHELTLKVPHGRQECLYQTVDQGDNIDLDFEVIGGSDTRKMSIDFKVFGADGIPILADFNKPQGVHSFMASHSGDFRFCFDNSPRSSDGGGTMGDEDKDVFFGLIVTSDKEDADDTEEIELPENHGMRDYNAYGLKTDDLENSLKSIRMELAHSRHWQFQLRAHEHRHRSIAEHNFERVNFWSLIYLLGLAMSGLMQVIMIRSLFDEKSWLAWIWSNTC